MRECNAESPKHDSKRFNSQGRRNTLPIWVYNLSMAYAIGYNFSPSSETCKFNAQTCFELKRTRSDIEKTGRNIIINNLNNVLKGNVCNEIFDSIHFSIPISITPIYSNF